LTIIRDVPYDRPFTTMAGFPLCEACNKEYVNPSDRRYHAQPISCFDCGPTVWLETKDHPRDSEVPDDTRARESMAHTRAQAREMLAGGKILAVKGIGGFTLMCDARNEEAVDTLRRRKNRLGKPLAVMAMTRTSASSIADFSETQLATFSSREAPIVIVPKSATYDVAEGVAPGVNDVGVMKAYTPLHRLLFDDDNDILVATSANWSTLPLTYRNDDARKDLADIADGFLMHNREIHVPVEDSVVLAHGDQVSPIRRSRGYAPLPVVIGQKDHCVLAVGAELKNTFALTRDGMAFISAHIGDMGSLETRSAYELSVSQMLGAHRRTPELIVVDKHPGYATRGWGMATAEELGVPVLEIQHHHGHALSLLGESREEQPLTFLVLDGTGYGDDGTIWGGEVLRLGANPLDYERINHLPSFDLPGGDSAVRHPWKSALGVLKKYDIDAVDVRAWQDANHGGGSPSRDEVLAVSSQLDAHLNCAQTTSAGRLFDAAASILGVCHQITYEAQGAMELEARSCHHDHDLAPTSVEYLIGHLIVGMKNRREVECLAHEFHVGLAHLLVEMVRESHPTTSIGLTGGVFANRLLTRVITTRLAQRGLVALTHRVVPAGDGGLSLGQAYAGYLHLVN
jgi:hydrogenase maturation protein HypF